MRARHRHINPTAVGASLALDARFLVASNDSTIETWTGRANSVNATQSSSLARPTFKTSILNNQPVVRFGGSQSLNVGNLNSQPLTVLIIAKNNNGNSYLFDGSATTRAAMGNGLSTGNDNSKMEMFAGSAVFGATQNSNTGEFYLWSGLFDGSGSTLKKNGEAFSSGNPGTGSLSGGMTIGNRFSLSYNLNGDISFICVFGWKNSNLSRRLEHAAAFSFKIACS